MHDELAAAEDLEGTLLECDDETRRAITDECLRALATASSPEERRELVERVVMANLQVARAIARRYRGRGIPLDDLEQTAGLALLSACRSFDPGLGHDFLSFAVPTIRGAVLKYFRDHGWTVRPPRRVRELQTRILHSVPVVDADESQAEALAAQLGESVAAVREALAARGCFRPASLDAPVGDGGVALAEVLPPDTEDPYESVVNRLAAAAALRRLDDRARRLLNMRFFEGRSQQAIAEELGTSQVQVSRELRRILLRIRELVDGLSVEGREAKVG